MFAWTGITEVAYVHDVRWVIHTRSKTPKHSANVSSKSAGFSPVLAHIVLTIPTLSMHVVLLQHKNMKTGFLLYYHNKTSKREKERYKRIKTNDQVVVLAVLLVVAVVLVVEEAKSVAAEDLIDISYITHSKVMYSTIDNRIEKH